MRLFDEKRQKITVGDKIQFRNIENGDVVTAKVKALHRFLTFEQLYNALPLDKCGYESAENADSADMIDYYSAEQIEKYGVVGIELDSVQNKNPVALHYDALIDQDNDPVHDPEPLKAYMDKWDGDSFVERLCLEDTKRVLEIGVGTGRLALKTAPLCKEFYGIDVSPKTVERAKENLAIHPNVTLICGDFLEYNFEHAFDTVYSSLTFMHVEDKQNAVSKVFELLSDGGVFVLSIDKNQEDFIDMGWGKIKIFPDTPEHMVSCLNKAGFHLTEQFETDFAHVFVAEKYCHCYCGHDCSKCVTYIATKTKNRALREQAQRFYQKEFA